MANEITRSHRFGNDPLTGAYRRGLTPKGAEEHEYEQQQKVVRLSRESIYAQYDSTFKQPTGARGGVWASPSEDAERREWNPPTRKCIRCNEEFPYTSTARIFCSVKCRTLTARERNNTTPEYHPHDYSMQMHHLVIDVDLKEYSLVDDDSGWREQDPDVIKALKALPKKRYGPPPPP